MGNGIFYNYINDIFLFEDVFLVVFMFYVGL